MEDGDREGAYSSRGRILFCVGCKILPQTKVNGAHTVESWVRGPHGFKDLSYGADVLLHASLVDWLVVRCKDACADLVSKYL